MIPTSAKCVPSQIPFWACHFTLGTRIVDSNENDPNRPHRIGDLASGMADFCAERQQFYAQRAQDFGYSEEIFRNVARTISEMPDDPVLVGTEAAFRRFDLFLRSQEEQVSKYRFDVSSAAYALGTATSSTAAAVYSDGFGIKPANLYKPGPPPTWSPDRMNQYAARLAKLDQELGSLSRSVWQAFYGGAENAERASLLSMRQLYDHLFSVLAPDEEVRKSPWFSAKDGEKRNQIQRRERLLFAANRRVKNPKLGAMLESEAEYVLEVYERLNILHMRNALDREAVRTLLASMQGVVEQWVDALEL